MTQMRSEEPHAFAVLDHGYVRLVETWGSDQAIIEAARMSTQKGFEGWGDWRDCEECGGKGAVAVSGPSAVAQCPACQGRGGSGTKGDERLLRYLYCNNHATPFEFAGMVIEIKAPLCVFREWHRHRAAGYNEASARFAPLPSEDYVPTVDRIMLTGGSNKQAGKEGDNVLSEADGLTWLSALAEVYAHAERVYQQGLDRGVPREIARLSMTVGRYSRMRATSNLRMWLHFLGLREAPNAQWEIRQYAGAVARLVARQFPKTYELYKGAAK